MHKALARRSDTKAYALLRTGYSIIIFSLLISGHIFSCSAYAADRGVIMPVEFRAGGVLTSLGKLEYTGDSLEIVEFTASEPGRVMVAPSVYVIIEKSAVEQGIYRIKAVNQNTVFASGSIDLRDTSQPKINLNLETGLTITNLSAEGQKLKERIIPQIKLGR